MNRVSPILGNRHNPKNLGRVDWWCIHPTYLDISKLDWILVDWEMVIHFQNLQTHGMFWFPWHGMTINHVPCFDPTMINKSNEFPLWLHFVDFLPLFVVKTSLCLVSFLFSGSPRFPEGDVGFSKTVPQYLLGRVPKMPKLLRFVEKPGFFSLNHRTNWRFTCAKHSFWLYLLQFLSKKYWRVAGIPSDCWYHMWWFVRAQTLLLSLIRLKAHQEETMFFFTGFQPYIVPSNRGRCSLAYSKWLFILQFESRIVLFPQIFDLKSQGTLQSKVQIKILGLGFIFWYLDPFLRSWKDDWASTAPQACSGAQSSDGESLLLMWEKQWFDKPSTTENGLYHLSKWWWLGMVYCCFTNISFFLIVGECWRILQFWLLKSS